MSDRFGQNDSNNQRQRQSCAQLWEQQAPKGAEQSPQGSAPPPAGGSPGATAPGPRRGLVGPSPTPSRRVPTPFKVDQEEGVRSRSRISAANSRGPRTSESPS